MYRIARYSFTIITAFCVMALAGECAVAQVLKGNAAYGSWHDGEPGLRRLLEPEDLPPIEKPSYGLAEVVPIPTGARPQVPDGFSVQLETSALRNPRVIRVAPNGDLFVADTRFDAVHVLRMPPGSARPSREEVFANGLKQPFGIAFYPLGPNPRWVYIANSDGVVRFPYKNGDLKATGRPEQIIAWIPTTHHYASLLVTEDGNGSNSRVAYREPVQGTFDAARGRDLYIAHCAVCHQVDGEGLPNVFPPLKGSGVVNKDDATKHIAVVLDGMQGARAGGVLYASAMPPFAGKLSDAEIADIIDYERSSWGNHGKPVTAAQVAADRARSK